MKVLSPAEQDKQDKQEKQDKQDRYKFWLIFEQGAIGVALVLPDGRFLRANSELCRMLGYSEEQLKKIHFRALTEPEDIEAEMALFKRTLANETATYRLEKRFLKSDGRHLWARVSVSLERDDQGKALHFVMVVQDMSEIRAAHEEVNRARDRYLAICDTIGDLVSVHDSKGNYLYASPAAEKLLGYTPEELLGSNAYTFLHPTDVLPIMDAHKRVAASSAHSCDRYRIRHKNGEYVWLETYSRPVGEEQLTDPEILCISHQVHAFEGEGGPVDERVQSLPTKEKPGTLDLRDELTGLMSWRAMEELASSRLASRRAATYPFGCLLVDADHFKEVNDHYGQLTADEVLKRIAQILGDCCRTEDYVGRCEGDRFFILLPDTDMAGTLIVGERIVRTVSTVLWPGLPPDKKLTVSIGGTCIVRPSNLSLKGMMQEVNAQLQRAKQMGRNRLVMDARQIARQQYQG